MNFYEYRKWAWEQKIKPSNRKFVLICLSEFADEKGTCFPKVETLADLTGQGKSTVRDHLKALEDDGFITRTRLRYKDGTLAQYRYFIQCQKSGLGNSTSANFAPSPAPTLPPHQRQISADNNNQLTTIEQSIVPPTPEKGEGDGKPITSFLDERLDPDEQIPFLKIFLPTKEFKDWARIDLRLEPDEIRDILIACVEYWRALSKTKKGKKTPRYWDVTIKNWFRKEAKSLGAHYRNSVVDSRTPAQKAETSPLDISNEVWEYDVRIFKDELNWRGHGPEPEKPGCLVPLAILQKFGYGLGGES